MALVRHQKEEVQDILDRQELQPEDVERMKLELEKLQRDTDAAMMRKDECKEIMFELEMQVRCQLRRSDEG